MVLQQTGGKQKYPLLCFPCNNWWYHKYISNHYKILTTYNWAEISHFNDWTHPSMGWTMKGAKHLLFPHETSCSFKTCITVLYFKWAITFLKYSENLNESHYVSCLKINSTGGMLACSMKAIFFFHLIIVKKNLKREWEDFTMCRKLIKPSRALLQIIKRSVYLQSLEPL